MSFHDDCLVFDGHTDLPTRLLARPADLSRRLDDGHLDLPRLRRGGVDALVTALFIPAQLEPEAGLRHADVLYRRLLEHLVPGELELAVSVDEVRRTVARGAVAAVPSLENGRPLSAPGGLETCAGWGLRVVTLCHWASHEWCDAATDEPRHDGLSPRGVELVRSMADHGMVPDVSHASDAAAQQTLEVARGPVVASHSSARALCDHPRNLPDSLVRELARRGGVVMANAYPAFIDPAAEEANRERLNLFYNSEEVQWDGDPETFPRYVEARHRLSADNPLPPVPLEVFIDHLMHLIEVAGEEHVGIGTDFDGIDATPEGLADAAGMPKVTEALLARGVDPAGVRLVLGENALRVLAEAERVAG